MSGKLTFTENTKKENGNTKKKPRTYFPTNANTTEERNYRKSVPTLYPLPTYPYKPIRSDIVSYHVAKIQSMNFHKMSELVAHVQSLGLPDSIEEQVLDRCTYLYGNDMNTPYVRTHRPKKGMEQFIPNVIPAFQQQQGIPIHEQYGMSKENFNDLYHGGKRTLTRKRKSRK